ncbi:MAG: hypothetical protein V4439_00655 [Patescibacteria group bacterium]
MKKNTNKKSAKGGMSGGKMLAVSAGVAALGAGAYYLLGPKSKVHQKKASALVSKVKKDIVSEIKRDIKKARPLVKKVIKKVTNTKKAKVSKK